MPSRIIGPLCCMPVFLCPFCATKHAFWPLRFFQLEAEDEDDITEPAAPSESESDALLSHTNQRNVAATAFPAAPSVLIQADAAESAADRKRDWRPE